MIDLSPEVLTVLMFAGLLIGLFMGHPLAFVLGGLAVIFGYIGWGPSVFYMFMNRIWGTMDNYVLLAIPLFIFMAQFLDRSGVAEDLFKALRYLLGQTKGGIALTVVVVSTIFAACTGIIGASVVTMGLLALPMMRKYGYNEELSYGAICAGGTLGILIPPSIMLVVMASEATISVGKLFAGAVMPGIILSLLYLIYVYIRCHLNPELGPPISKEERAAVTSKDIMWMVLKSLVPPLVLILGVLGSIFFGIATPTEASGVGAFLAFLMVIGYGKFTWNGLYQAAIQTAKTNTMVIIILCGATCFTGVFLGIGGGDVVTEFVTGLGMGKWGTFWVMMLIVFLLGMFIDWIGIVLICFPLFLPIAKELGFDPIWFVIMMAVNLQASFLTPPFGYALFYIKGVDPDRIDIKKVYWGIIPFVALMLIGLIICAYFPQAVMWLPSMIVD
ncbi:MAG TPA: TRAP transporter large permease subunit [Deltaproteobacteria bacterium]|nr:TRAP transporter large permease subunit [Deltaproteobacteria bacterium]HPJ92459.1 TRAP transporter large permease subunit [Deltaproteobacteria bacterium]HPR50260.1 TRAP transporter large permease subunit [Deltaproteobacteria bacterium]